MKRKKYLISILIIAGIFIGSYVVVFATGKLIMSGSDEVQKPQSSASSDASGSERSSKDSGSENSSGKEKSGSEGGEASGKKDESDVSGESSDHGSKEETSDESEASANSESSDENTSDSSSESKAPGDESSKETEKSEGSTSVEHDAELVSFLGNAGYSTDDIDALGCRQLITVSSSGNTATVSFYKRDSSGSWKNDPSLTTSGFVGGNGVSKNSFEGSYETPYGLYPVGDAFYIDSAPQTGLDMFRVTDDTYWVDDPSSVFYNQHVEGTDQKDWNSAEHMIDYYYSYRYGFVIEFNTSPIVPGKGSAIFFHISSQPTAGCVGVPDYMMTAYLSALDKGENPYIFVQ